MSVVLVTGASGFVGGRLVARLRERAGLELHVLSRRPDPGGALAAAGVRVHAVDLTDPRRVAAVVRPLAPDRVFHLAAMAHPGDCEARPAAAFAVQAGGSAALLAALEGTEARTLVASTAQVYGPGPGSGGGRLHESDPLRARSVYGRSKRCAEDVARRFAARGGFAVVARPFNHTGRGQSTRYVVPALAAELRRAVAEDRPMRTGNLFPRRDFLHVDDVLDAYELLLERGVPGEAYNVCRGEGTEIGRVLAGLQAHLDADVPVEPDPARIRAGDPPEIVGDPSRLAALGWAPRVPVDALLAEVADAAASVAR